MLKNSASGVLASLRGSTYRNVCLASPLTAALLDSIFEHPEATVISAPLCNVPKALYAKTECFRSLPDDLRLKWKDEWREPIVETSLLNPYLSAKHQYPLSQARLERILASLMKGFAQTLKRHSRDHLIGHLVL